ncbi:MAG: arylesterase [Methylococcales bacterium]
MKKILIILMVCGLSPVGASPATIVIYGDSISAAYGIGLDLGWVTFLQKKLQSEGYNYDVSNESISGETTAGGVARIDEVLAATKPKVLILELGANDGLRGLSPVIMKQNLSMIINRAHQSGAKVLLISMRIPPNYGPRYTELFYQTYPALAKTLKIPYVPFILNDIALNKKLMQGDGLHPNAEAQPLIADKIWFYLQPLLVTVQ